VVYQVPKTLIGKVFERIFETRFNLAKGKYSFPTIRDFDKKKKI